MKNKILVRTLFMLSAISVCSPAWAGMKFKEKSHSSVNTQEEWKGPSPQTQFGASLLFGPSFFDADFGFGVLGAFSYEILGDGFIPDINDVVYIEAELGPILLSGANAFLVGAHLRWDFIKDHEWTFFAMGGLGSAITDRSRVSPFRLYPKLGVGAFWRIHESVRLRAEVSQSQILAGIHFDF